jgi:coenzyme PQQ precursor peptide PqqA
VGAVVLIIIKPTGRKLMAWNTPKITEIAVGLEINSYACAEA